MTSRDSTPTVSFRFEDAGCPKRLLFAVKIVEYADESFVNVLSGLRVRSSEAHCSTPQHKGTQVTRMSGSSDQCTIYRTDGNLADASRNRSTQPGVVLMGGGADVEEAFLWMLCRSDGGHFVVLGASGEDGYNDWIMELSRRHHERAPVISGVTTIICHQREASELPNVLDILSDASCIFLKGGDQSLYIDYWRNTPVQRVLQEKLLRVPVGGTSAGLAVLGGYSFTAKNDTISSAEALKNPYDHRVVLLGLRESNELHYPTTTGHKGGPGGAGVPNDLPFLSIPFLDNVLTDSHFCSRDRMGRLITFLCRLRKSDEEEMAVVVPEGRSSQEERRRREQRRRHLGVGVDDSTALILDVATGDARVVGSSSVNLVRLASHDSSCRCEMNEPLTCMNVECLQLGPGDEYMFRGRRGNDDGAKEEEKVWRDRSIKLHVVEGKLHVVEGDYRKMGEDGVA